MAKVFFRSFGIVFFVILLCIPKQSCDDPFIFRIDCSECFTSPPDYTLVYITVNRNAENPKIPITIYYGPFEDNNIAAVDTARSNKIWISLQTNKHYTLKGEYYKNDRLYNVINGTHLRLRYDDETCDEPCYYIIGDEVDLTLKF
jgi:hypothetical protein